VAAIDDFLAALKAQESGGNYTAHNPSGASGAYQYMPGTWANYKGYANAADAPPAIQDEKARADAQRYFSQFGDWGSVAKAWYAGPGFAKKNQTAKQGEYPSIQSYANQVVGRMGGTVQAASVGQPGSVVTAAPAAPTGAALEEKITALALTQHGGVLAPFVQDPEIRALLGRYVKGEIDDNTLQGLVMQTKLWTTSSAAQRAWQTLETSDPATASAKLQAQAATLMAAARQRGLPLDQGRADLLAKQSLQFGWNDAQINAAILAEVDFLKEPAASPVGATLEALRQVANSYVVYADDQMLADWARAIASGDQTTASFATTMAGIAKAFYANPGLTSAIDAGLTTKQFAQQMTGDLAQTLELNPAAIDYRDPKWRRFIEANPATGQAWSTTEIDRVARTEEQYGFDNTSRAVTEKTQIGMGALKAWGLV
jgi:hypothetical protein